MKTHLLLSLGLALASVAHAGAADSSPPPAAPAAEKTPADLDHEAAFTLWRAEPPAGVQHPSRAFFEFQDQKLRQFVAAVRAFGDKYPDDPRRYDGWVQSSFTRPLFIAGFKPAFDEQPGRQNILEDRAALHAFLAEQRELLTRVIEAPDATNRHRGGAFFALIADTRNTARDSGEPFDITTFRPLVDRVAASLADERALPVVEQYLAALAQTSPPAAADYQATLQAWPALATALKTAEENRRAEEARQAEAAALRAVEIGSLKFTAADGREVDVASLKGKVVLIDFWATWCGPCIAEIPNLVENYKKYHDQGFEIIGITLENPGARPNDTPGQTAAKLEAAKNKMLEFARKNAMPWPQHFDGKWWKNDYAVKYGINAIPAMFLLDQEGRIVTTDARGEKLEAELKRLLKL